MKKISAFITAFLLVTLSFPFTASAVTLQGYWADNCDITDEAVYLRGWVCFAEGSIDSFGYRIDGGEPVFDPGHTEDRPDVWDYFKTERDACNGFCFTVDLTQLPDGEHTVTLTVRATDGTVVDLETYDFYKGRKLPAVSRCHYDEAATYETAVSLRGWVVIENDTIADVGYRFDDNYVVYSVYEDRPDVDAYFGVDPSVTAGFYLVFDLTDVTEEDHILHIVVKTASGALLDVNEIYDGYAFAGVKPVDPGLKPIPPMIDANGEPITMLKTAIRGALAGIAAAENK